MHAKRVHGKFNYGSLSRSLSEACSNSSRHCLLKLEFVIDVWGVLGATFTGRVEIPRVILLDPALLVAPECVACQVRVLFVESTLCPC